MTIADGIRQLVGIGVEPDYSFSKRIRIELTNIVALMTIPALVLTILSESRAERHPYEFIIYIYWVSIISIPLLLNYWKRHFSSQLALCISSIVFATALYTLYGPDLVVEPLYFTFFLCIVYFFEWRIASVLLGMSIASYFFAQYLWTIFDAPLASYLNPSSNGSSFIYSSLIVWITLHRILSENAANSHQIAAQNKELAFKNEELQRFAYVTAHDLKTPLRNLNSYLGLIKLKHEQKDENIGAYIDTSQESAKRLYQLINDILDYTKIKHDSTERQWININEVIADIKQDFGYDIEMGVKRIETEPMSMILFDKAQLRILLYNIIDNGLKYNDSNVPTVRITANEVKDKWVMKINDNGIGIEETFHSQVFEMFSRLHTHDKYFGSGLGLSIVRRIVESHQGEVSIKSIAGHGSTFILRFPKEIIKAPELTITSFSQN